MSTLEKRIKSEEEKIDKYDDMLKGKVKVNNLSDLAEASRGRVKSLRHLESLQKMKAKKDHRSDYIDYKLKKREDIFKKEQELGSKAFKHLSDVDAIKERQAELSSIATRGLSLQQKALEKAKVGAAIKGQQKAMTRRMSSILAGQGMRGAAASAVMRNIDQKAKKQMAQFEMGQMARSYAEKQKAADKKAAMDMDIAQFDIGQDKSKLELAQSERIFRDRRVSNLSNTLKGLGKSKEATEKAIMDADY